MTEKLRYLITGGAGFIGSHLSARLLDEGHRVTVIDDLSTGAWRNIAPLEGNPNFRAVIADMNDADLLESEVAPADFVFHLASAVGVRLVVERPVETIRRIVEPTERLTDVCTKYRRPILLTSTSEVYGISERIPFREEDPVVIGATVKPRWAYASAKMLDEFYLLAHHKETALPVFIVRLFNTVGARQTGKYGMVLPRFVSAALAGEPLVVHGDGTQKRCFCSVLDVVEGLIRVSRAPEAAGKVMNLGSDDEIAIGDLARRVLELTGSNSPVALKSYEEVFGPDFEDMHRRVPSLERARRLIGWKPVYTIDDIIRQVIDDKRKTKD
ncbi:MAG: GDP-mannose 4,6-dehydratase [Thermoguttaceae bacterium]|nr:GDP-mannose 4,6-dehydratase [Thermoguttaceae bacterium]